MDPPNLPASGDSATAGDSSALMGFKNASSLLKRSSDGSLRNASGGQPPIPRAQGVNGSRSHDSATEEGMAAANGNGKDGAGAPVKTKPINRPASSKNAIVYNAVQRRNPVLQNIKNVGIEIGDIVADYQVGTHNGVLFLSLKYHRLHPEYIHQRIEKIKNMYNVRILLILCDINEHQQSLRELAKIAIINNLTTIVAWSNDEVAQYLTTFKAYEHKSDDSLKERVHQEYHDQLQHVLTSGKKVNKTDADNLASQFGSFASIVRQPSKLLSNVKGLGATKVTSLLDAFNKPFLVGGLQREGHDQTDSSGAGPLPTVVEGPGPGGATDPIGSPEWPDSPPDGDADESAKGLVPDIDLGSNGMGRERAPSRSPGLSPEAPGGNGDGRGDAEVWKDPLDEDEDEDDVARGQDDEGRSNKRARLAD